MDNGDVQVLLSGVDGTAAPGAARRMRCLGFSKATSRLLVTLGLVALALQRIKGGGRRHGPAHPPAARARDLGPAAAAWPAAQAEQCPDRPTWHQLDSWDDWAPRWNCSFRIPWVPAGHGKAASLPLFLIIGEQKAGTTFLRTLLDQHPQLQAGTGLFGLTGGETHFFDRAIQHRYISVEPRAMAKAYADYFVVPSNGSDASPPVAFGFDTTPSYLAWTGPVPWRLSLVLPHVKIIALVRDPVRRYESARKMYSCFASGVQARGEKFHREHAMEEYLAGQPESGTGDDRMLPLHRGLYMANLRRWLLHFRKSQLLVLTSEELFADPASVAKRVTAEFLRLPVFEPDVPEALSTGRNQGHRCRGAAEEYAMSKDDRARLARFYHPHNLELEAFLGQELDWEKPSPEDEGGTLALSR